jgi:hypothetical protein
MPTADDDGADDMPAGRRDHRPTGVRLGTPTFKRRRAGGDGGVMSKLATKKSDDVVVPERVEPPSQGVLLLIRQMASTGIGQGEIATRLRDDFGVQGAAAIVHVAF